MTHEIDEKLQHQEATVKRVEQDIFELNKIQVKNQHAIAVLGKNIEETGATIHDKIDTFRLGPRLELRHYDSSRERKWYHSTAGAFHCVLNFYQSNDHSYRATWSIRCVIQGLACCAFHKLEKNLWHIGLECFIYVAR